VFVVFDGANNVPKSSLSSSSFGEEKQRVERRGTVGRDRGGEQRGVGERDGKTRAGAEIGGARLWTTIRFFLSIVYTASLFESLMRVYLFSSLKRYG
jgi:hypothetical protein